MHFYQISNFKNLLPAELIQTLEIMIIFISLYVMILLLLINAENKKFFQKQK